MKKTNAKSRLITHSIVAVVLTVVLISGIVWGPSCNGGINISPFSCNGISFGGYTYDDADKYSVGEFTLDEEITSIDIDWIAGDVNIVATAENKVSASESDVDDDDNKLRYRVVDGKLMIKFKKSERAFDSNLKKELNLYIPAEMADKLQLVKVQCVSATLDMENVTIKNLDIETVSGKMEAKNVVIDTVKLESVSGGVNIAGTVDKLDAELVSGGIKVTSDKQLSSINVETVSGNITVAMPEGDGFTAEMDSVSGDLNVDFETTTRDEKRIFGDGSADYGFETVSGDVNLKKLD